MPTKRQQPGLQVVSRPGSKFLYLRGTVRGQRVYESTQTDDPALAEEARSARETELYRCAIHGIKPKVSFAAAALSYLEAEPRSAATKVALGKLLRFLGPSLACDDIDQGRLDVAARRLCRPTATPATRLRQVITPAKAVLSHAARRGWCPAPIFERVKGGQSRTDWLAPAEAEALIAHAAAHLKPLLVFLFCTGARLGEALALEWRDVDLQHSRATLRDTKNGRDRLVELCPRALVALANLPQREGRVFRQRGGKPYRRTEESATVGYGGQIRKGWASALEAAEIGKPVTPHHARHSFASWHYVVHRDLLRLKRDGDWSSVTLVERYAHLVPDGLVPAIERFWGVGADNRHAERA
jgi:integrase